MDVRWILNSTPVGNLGLLHIIDWNPYSGWDYHVLSIID